MPFSDHCLNRQESPRGKFRSPEQKQSMFLGCELSSGDGMAQKEGSGVAYRLGSSTFCPSFISWLF